MLKAVLFDMDGTLGDTLPLCIESFRVCVQEVVGTKPSAEEVVSHFGLSDRGVLGKLLGMDPESPELPVTHFQKVYERLHPELAPAPFPGAVEMLLALKAAGLRVGLISGKEIYTAGPTIRRYGMEGIFEWCGLGVPSHNCKHERLAEVMQLWGLHPEEMIYVGDAPSDIELSHRAGVRIINAAWAGSAAEVEAACLALHPDYRLDNFNLLLPLIKSL
ncbi:MAG: HAD hydrolase-like protein [Akkermansia sp.]|nr:HAD hydrolase-like protein [Akkermansia sp.]